MANHGFVTRAKKPFKFKEVTAALHEINRNFFKDKLIIVPWSNKDGWYLRYQHDKLFLELPIWLATKRKLEIRHTGRGQFGWWIDSVTINELARIFDGTISDEGVERKWKFNPESSCCLRTFIKNDLSSFLSGIALSVAEIVALSRVPKEFL